MARLSISWVIPVVTLLELMVLTQPTVFDNSNSFISNNHVRYVVDDIATIQSDILSDVHGSTLSSLSMKLKLKFDPELLDFQQKPLGVPHLAKVMLYNTDKNQSIDMTSISGNTVHFHCSFFEDKQIPPLGNTTFNVVFLGREEGTIESSLFIHTTEGHFRYRVRAASVHSPYRLRPLVAVRLPPNVLFSPIVYMHNPHTEPIQIVEVYSSGGDFNLELPSGDTEGSRDMWEIPPFETRPVIRLRFYSRIEQNQTAYIRIKLNTTDPSSPLLIIPLEVTVSNDVPLYHAQGGLDFGVGGSLEAPRQVPLVLQLNPGGGGAGAGGKKLSAAAVLRSIHTISSDCPHVVGVERVVQVGGGSGGKGGGGGAVTVANLTLDWKMAYETNTFSGKIKITYKNIKTRTEIPFYLTVVNGGLFYNASSTKFYVNLKEKFAPKKFTIRNDFYTPITILNASLSPEAAIYFTITDFKRQALKSREERAIFVIKLKDNLKHSCYLKSFITVETNISTIQIPLMCYDGKFKAFLPYKSKDNSLDLGLIGFESKKMFTILLVNDNPVAIKIKEIHNSLISTYFELHGCMRRYDEHLLQNTFENAFACENRTVKPKEVAILRLWIDAKRTESRIWGDISVVTQFEELSIPVHFQIAPGKLEIGPDRLVFDQCFPGKICSHPLKVHSTFNEVMLIDDILPIPPDVRIYAKHSGHIPSKATKVIGNLYLDPKAACQDECYLGLSASDFETWLSTLSLTTPTASPTSHTHFDLHLVNLLHSRYHTPTTSPTNSWANLTLRLDTSRVRGHIFHTRVRMEWPKLLHHVSASAPERVGGRTDGEGGVEGEEEEEKRGTRTLVEGRGDGWGGGNGSSVVVVTVPLTQLGATRRVALVVRNPSSVPVAVQVVLDGDYGGWEELYEGLPPSFLPPPTTANPSSTHARSPPPTNFPLPPHHHHHHQSPSAPTQSQSPSPFSFDLYDPLEIHTMHMIFRRQLDRPLLTLHPNSKAWLLDPGDNLTVIIAYRALEAGDSRGLVFIRNNLTVLEVVELRGTGARLHFKFGNRKPGSSQPLQFELTEKHLKDCEPNQKRYAAPNLTVKRSFTARNNGEFDIAVTTFYINDFECEGYGFRVLNCEPFVLPPNATRKINIAFTPDFTLSKITRTLILVTNLNTPVNYTLVTTVPYHYLSLCAGILGRPPFENYLYYLFVCTLTITLVIVVILAVMDSDRVLKTALASMSKQCHPHAQHTLDLRLVGAQTRSEFKTAASKEAPGIPVISADKETQLIGTGGGDGAHAHSVAAGESICKKTPVAARNDVKQDGELSKSGGHEARKAVVKLEEKYTAVVPTVGKAKKKMSRKNEPVESTNHLDVQHKPKSSSHSSMNDSINTKHKTSKNSSLFIHPDHQNHTTNHDVTSTSTTIHNSHTPNASTVNVNVNTSYISSAEKDSAANSKKSSHKDKENCVRKEHPHKMAATSAKKQTVFAVKSSPPNVIASLSHNKVEVSNSVVANCSGGYEEDTSSQTESSSSREEEKLVKKVQTTPEVYYEKNKVERRKSTPKSMKIKEQKMDKENHEKQDSIFKPFKSKSNKSNRDNHRRNTGEKQTLSKKFSLDKNTKLNDSSNHHSFNTLSYSTNSTNNVRGSPSFSRWDENRASFSDVVARNEAVTNAVTSGSPVSNSSGSTSGSGGCSGNATSATVVTSQQRPLLQPSVLNSGRNQHTNTAQSTSTASLQSHPNSIPALITTKPILCVEPKQSSPSLGPIGSKKTENRTEKVYLNKKNSNTNSSMESIIDTGNNHVKHNNMSHLNMQAQRNAGLGGNVSQSASYLSDALAYQTSAFLDLGFDGGFRNDTNWMQQQQCNQRMDVFGVGRYDDNGSPDLWNNSAPTGPAPSSPMSTGNTHPSPQSTLPQTNNNTPPTYPTTTNNNPSPSTAYYWDQISATTAGSSATSLYSNSSVLQQAMTTAAGAAGAQVQQQQAMQVQQQDPSGGYLWGGSTVWQPWTPPRTPTRTPPGFMPREEDEEELRFQQSMQPQETHLYNPFGNNIWNQQQNNPWNYPQGQQ